MKLGITLLTIGIVSLAIAIPFWIWGATASPAQLAEANLYREGLIYSAVFGVIVGLAMTIIGAIRVLGR